MGSGYTVEGQKTGVEKFGGLQIEIIPSYEERLRTFLPEPTGSSTLNDLLDLSCILDEEKTPLELGMRPGAKIRSYPSMPTYWASCVISDLTGDAQEEDTRTKVRRVCNKHSHMLTCSVGPISRTCREVNPI